MHFSLVTQAIIIGPNALSLYGRVGNLNEVVALTEGFVPSDAGEYGFVVSYLVAYLYDAIIDIVPVYHSPQLASVEFSAANVLTLLQSPFTATSELVAPAVLYNMEMVMPVSGPLPAMVQEDYETRGWMSDMLVNVYKSMDVWEYSVYATTWFMSSLDASHSSCCDLQVQQVCVGGVVWRPNSTGSVGLCF